MTRGRPREGVGTGENGAEIPVDRRSPKSGCSDEVEALIVVGGGGTVKKTLPSSSSTIRDEGGVALAAGDGVGKGWETGASGPADVSVAIAAGEGGGEEDRLGLSRADRRRAARAATSRAVMVVSSSADPPSDASSLSATAAPMVAAGASGAVRWAAVVIVGAASADRSRGSSGPNQTVLANARSSSQTPSASTNLSLWDLIGARSSLLASLS